MSLRDLLILYLVAGFACAVAIYRTSGESRPRAAVQAALAVPLWPLWAPIALTGKKPDGRRSEAVADTGARIRKALREAVEACAGTPLEALLPRDMAARIDANVERAASRHAELERLLGTPSFDLSKAETRVGALEKSGATARSIATARLSLENVRRLRALRERDARALEELSDLVQALRTQLVLARFAGSSVEGIGGIVTEVRARVEGLDEAIDIDQEADTRETGET